MPRGEELNQRIRDRRREQILDAAQRCFARRGLAATGTADLAAAAGVSHGLVYRYFRSKEALYCEVVKRGVASSLETIMPILEEREGSAGDRLRRLCEAQLELARREPDWALIAVQAMTNEGTPDQARAALDAHGEALVRALIRLIQAGQEAGEIISGEPMELALLFLAVVHGLSLVAVEGATAARPGPAAVMRMFQP